MCHEFDCSVEGTLSRPPLLVISKKLAISLRWMTDGTRAVELQKNQVFA